MSLKIGVIGTGAMGRNHVRVYSDLAAADLVGVADIDHRAAGEIAQKFGTRAFASPLELMEAAKPDAITLAVPTVDHHKLALAVIERGIHLLIEKPIAFSLEHGRDIIQAAEKAGVTLMVGHIERFNPAVIDLKERLAKGELGRVFQLDARREGPFPAWIRDVGVVIDLAVHDLDIIRYISGKEIRRIYAETEQRIHSSHEDLVAGLLRLDDGSVATLSVNWLTPTKIRELTVTGERGMFRVDYLTQDLYFYENATAQNPDWDALQMLRGVSEGRMIRNVVDKQEPLRKELEAFLEAVQSGDPPPVTGQDGLLALKLAHEVVRSGRNGVVVELKE